MLPRLCVRGPLNWMKAWLLSILNVPFKVLVKSSWPPLPLICVIVRVKLPRIAEKFGAVVADVSNVPKLT